MQTRHLKLYFIVKPMEQLHVFGIDAIHYLQGLFGHYEELMLVLSHLGDPRNAFLLYFPISYCLHKPTGAAVLWLACLSEWINAILKWLLYGERPYWWIRESGLYQHNATLIKQYSLTCETGPGSPSGHAMVTSCVIYCITTSLLYHMKPRLPFKCVAWSLYVVFMLAVTLSRCFIATHFPHQVLLGTLAGIALSVQFSKVQIEHLRVKHYVSCSFLIPGSCLLLYMLLKVCGLDPGWSITLATKWCQRSEFVHLDTTPFNAVIRDAGSILGFGLVVMMSQKYKWQREVPSLYVKTLHIILSLLFCQVLENFKLSNVDPYVFYSFTFVKFCVLVVGVHFTTFLYLSHTQEYTNKRQ